MISRSILVTTYLLELGEENYTGKQDRMSIYGYASARIDFLQWRIQNVEPTNAY